MKQLFILIMIVLSVFLGYSKNQSPQISNYTKYNVNQNRAYFYSQPSFEFKRKAYLVFGDVVSGSLKKDGFVYVEFVNSNGIKTTGWLLISDLINAQSSTSRNSVDYETYYNSAITFLINGDYDNALKNINKSISINPSNANSYYIRGNVYQKQSNYNYALSDYKQAIKLNPSLIDAIMKCAIIYGKMNDKVSACRYFKKACDLGNNEACNGYNRFCN